MTTILHLCADIGSDSRPYVDAGCDVICIGKNVGVENYHPPKGVYGIIANPPCTEFSTANYAVTRDKDKGLFLVKHCQRIIKEAKPKFWVIENPATGKLKDYLGKPRMIYQPRHFGSPWTKKTALWGDFNEPKKLFFDWDHVPKIEELYIRPGRPKPALAFMHVGRKKFIREFDAFNVVDDAGFRSLCSQGFAKAFFEANNDIDPEIMDLAK